MPEKLAVHGGAPAKHKPFPNWPQYDQGEEKALLEVLHSGVWWRTPGTQTLAFEEKFAAYQQAAYGVACTNGTAALEIAIAALGIGLGDEVIVPDFTFVASASAVLFVGAMPVLVDVDPGTLCIDTAKIEAAITPRTKAIVAVHIAGHPADLDRLKEIARIHNLFLIEDSSHAHGSEWKGHKVGSIGTVGTFSFQASKLMTAGEGGMVITNNEDLAVRIRSVHDCGRMPDQWFYSHYIYGSNYRLSEWQGAVLSQQLSRLDEQAAIRTKNAAYLDECLPQIDGIRPQALDPRVTRNGHYCYIFHYDRAAFQGLSTEGFIAALNAEGIPTQAAYPSVRKLDVFQNGEFRKRLSPEHAREDFPFLRADFSVTDDAAVNTVWLVHRTLLGGAEDTAEIVSAIKKIQQHAGELA
ncbi:MAG TPA: DegT/DnrJ/EryC1/StrS family aminotransferase [Anaerolineaceae bacterium]|jgi:dTDP-4-amino-4,6-dideoxygalactose transaminase